MNLFTYMIFTFMATTIYSMKWRKEMNPKKQNRTGKHMEAHRFKYNSVLHPHEIETIKQFLNYSALHL
jgi:hypothetical protein